MYGHIYYVGLCSGYFNNFRHRIHLMLTEKKVLVVVEIHSECRRMRLWATYPKTKSFYEKVSSVLEPSEYGSWRQERTTTSQTVFQNLVPKVSTFSTCLVRTFLRCLVALRKTKQSWGINLMFDGTHTLYRAALSLIPPSFRVVKYRIGPLIDCSILVHN